MTKDNFTKDIQNLKQVIASLDSSQQEEFILDRLKAGDKVSEIFGTPNTGKSPKKEDLAMRFEEYVAAFKGLHAAIVDSPQLTEEQKKQSATLSTMVDQLAEQMRNNLKNSED